MLYNWLYPFHTEYSFLNVFRYLSFRIIYAAVTAFLIAFVLAPWVIRKLQDIKLGQQIRGDGPKAPPGEERHAHHGRDSHPLCRGPLDAPLGRHREAIRLACARRHVGVRRDWIRRRLSQVHQGPIQGIVGLAEIHGASGAGLGDCAGPLFPARLYDEAQYSVLQECRSGSRLVVRRLCCASHCREFQCRQFDGWSRWVWRSDRS